MTDLLVRLTSTVALEEFEDECVGAGCLDAPLE